MTLLQQIQMEVVDSSSDLASVLRKCRILAQRLGHEGFKEWVIHELDGYPPGKDLPDYRICRHNIVIGHFFGAFGRELKGAQIPQSSIPEEFREMLTTVRFGQGVAWFAETITSCKDGMIRAKWLAEATQIIGQGTIYDGMYLAEAHQIVTTATMAGIISNIRNKVLNFVLEVESSNPEAGEAVKDKNQISKEHVQNIFNTVIKGDVGNMAQASSDFSQQSVVQIKQGDMNSLVQKLTELGISPEDIRELRSAVLEEPGVSGKTFGNKIHSWIGKIVSKAAQGAYTVSTSVVGHVITDALKKYYGI